MPFPCNFRWLLIPLESMNILSTLLTVSGLSLFEVVNSLDNAVINAEVLATMGQKARRWFLLWGMFFAVFLIRGLLPWLIVWGAAPSLGPIGALTATFSSSPEVHAAVETAAPVLLIVGGTFLLFLFLHWLFMEPKSYGLRGERYFHSKAGWFYTTVSLLLLLIAWLAKEHNPSLQFGAILGSTLFFITHGFKQSAEQQEAVLTSKEGKKQSDLSKILYLEVIDAVFSIDGVLGAFAFTFSVPLIILGNGLGALVVRQLTLGNISRIKKYRFLKNGAMYSVAVLGLVMVVESFGVHLPSWLSPIGTALIILYFFQRSKVESAKE